MRHPRNQNQTTPPDNGIAPGARGLLNRAAGARHFRLDRFPPKDALSKLVEHYWLVRWDLTGKPDYIQQTLPHPSVHLVLDPQQGSAVRGVIRRSFQYRLQGSGSVFGVKFLPGAFSAFYSDSVHELTDHALSLEEFWGETATRWEMMLQEKSPELLVETMDRALCDQEPTLDETARQAGELVLAVERNPELCSTEQLARYGEMSARRLQRLFRRYVGVSPKWVIERYRMIEAVEAINNGITVDLTELAHRLGYFDQAHFSKAFSALVGVPPSHYQAHYQAKP